jgi:ribosomal protein S18 acetylase RimI-like enzyme
MPKIRRYRSQDFVDYVAALEKTTKWGKKATGELRARLEKLRRQDQIWVAEIDVRCVGFMILVPEADGSLEVDWLDVHPDFHHTGIGTMLVQKAEKVAKAKGRTALSVHTSDKNKAMQGFAEKNGFVLFERLKGFYGKRKDALRFKKPIVL